MKPSQWWLGVALLVCSFVVPVYAQEETYFARLDEWVGRGAPAEDVESVNETCQRLVVLHATTLEKLRFMTVDREEAQFRIDICVKLTAHRAHSQPEFSNPEVVTIVCGSDVSALFRKLCNRTGLP